MSYTNKQAELIKVWLAGKLQRLNVLEGSVRSGKTWISLVLWAFWVGTSPINGNYLMCAKSLTALRHNCLELLIELVGDNFTYSISAKEGQLFGRRIFLEGCNDARAESKIRGMTLQGAYCDELTQITNEFFTMLLSRLSEPGAKLLATTNPDSPLHWLKTNYLNRAGELDLLGMKFTIDDNEFLDPQFVSEIKREYTGVFYDRFILGLWVKAEGLVYPMFETNLHVVPEDKMPHNRRTQKQIAQNVDTYERYYISCDYGTMNPSAFILWGQLNGAYYAIDEYYYDGRKSTPRTDEEHYEALRRLVGGKAITKIIIDPSAASFITLIQRKKEFSVAAADNAVIDGIRECGTALKNGLVKFSSRCANTIQEFGLYSWDEKKTEDQVIKENDHAMDAFRYLVKTLRIAVAKIKAA